MADLNIEATRSRVNTSGAGSTTSAAQTPRVFPSVSITVSRSKVRRWLCLRFCRHTSDTQRFSANTGNRGIFASELTGFLTRTKYYVGTRKRSEEHTSELQ